MPSQPEKACFSNFNKVAPSASVPGHAMHSILPGCLFSKAWGVTNHQKQHISPQSASPSRPHLGSHPHPGMVWMSITDLLSSRQSHSSQRSLTSRNDLPFTFLITKCLPFLSAIKKLCGDCGKTKRSLEIL